MTFEQSFQYSIDTFLYPYPNNNDKNHLQKIAIIGNINSSTDTIANLLKELANHFNTISVIQLGSQKAIANSSLEDLIHSCIEQNIVPILIGWNEQDIRSISQSGRKIFLSNKVYEHIDPNESHTYIGYQRHFSEMEVLQNIDENTYGSMSLGKLRTIPLAVEPIIRDATFMHFNLNVIKSSEVSNIVDAYPTGLTTEELCQIARYSGGANELKCICFDHIDSSCNSELKVVATVIWYFLEGRNHLSLDHPSASSDFSSYIVSYLDDDIVFKRHNITHRIWAYINDEYFACTNDEYIQSIDGSLPDRFIKLILS